MDGNKSNNHDRFFLLIRNKYGYGENETVILGLVRGEDYARKILERYRSKLLAHELIKRLDDLKRVRAHRGDVYTWHECPAYLRCVKSEDKIRKAWDWMKSKCEWNITGWLEIEEIKIRKPDAPADEPGAGA